jgi:hypothetical protein
MGIFDDLFLLRSFVSIVENGSTSASAKALWMRRTLPTNCGQSSSHSVNQAAKPLRREFSWS